MLLRMPGGGSISFDGPADLLATLTQLAPSCPDDFQAELRLRVVFARPDLLRPLDPAAARLDLFLADQGPDFLLFALRDLRRQLEAEPSVFLRVARETADCTLHLAEQTPYHHKLARWFLVGLLASVTGLRFAHASAVGDGRKAALILGAHGSGKSTLAAAAVVAGLDLLAEGVALIDGAGHLVPFFMDGAPRLRLGAEAWEQVRPRVPAAWPEPERYPSRAGGVGEKVVLRPPASDRSQASVPLAAAWLPHIVGDPAARLAIDPVLRSEALAEVTGELEDRRIGALREGLAPARWLDARRPDPRERWQHDFPERVLRVRGIEDFAALAGKLRREGVGLEP